MKKLIGLFLTVSIFSSSCGYQAVRSVTVNDSLQPIYIQENTPLAIEIKRQLLAAGIAVSSSPSEANSDLRPENIISTNRSLTVNISGRDAEKLQEMTTRIIWRKRNGEVIAEHAIRAETLQVTNPDQPLAAKNENDQLLNSLTADLASQVLRLMRQTEQSN